MVTNQNRFLYFFLFDKFKGNTFLHNALKISFLPCRYTPHFVNCQNQLSLTESLFNGTKPDINPNSATKKNATLTLNTNNVMLTHMVELQDNNNNALEHICL